MQYGTTCSSTDQLDVVADQDVGNDVLVCEVPSWSWVDASDEEKAEYDAYVNVGW